MKFLIKDPNSNILSKGLIYKENNSKNNLKLKSELIKEQNNFCAYTEKYIQKLDATEVEHFNSALKFNDNYYNYYAVLRVANLYKKDSVYKNATFFNSLFFQSAKQFEKRIKFVDNTYIEIDENDKESKEFIDFLGFNHERLYTDRRKHMKRLKRNFEDANYSKNQIINYLKEHKEDLSFITAIENEFEIDLTNLIKK